MARVTTLILASLLPSLVGGDSCDERPQCSCPEADDQADCCEDNCCSTCGLTFNHTYKSSLECEWRVMDQTYNVSEPTLLVVDVEQSCPWEEKGLLNLWQCQRCAALHKPCEGQYAACKGCCDTPWHTNLRVPTQHSCDEIKRFYKVYNNHKVKCDKQVTPVGSVTIQKISVGGSEPYDSGKLVSECETDVDKVTCQRIPVKMEFECNQCNIGSPELLQMCCDKGVEWLSSAALDQLRDDGFEPFVWLSGCHGNEINMPKGHQAVPWPHWADYRDYTEAAIDANMEEWLEDEVCSILDPTCGKPDDTDEPTTTTTVASCETTNVLFSASSDDAATWNNKWDGWTQLGDHSTNGEGKTVCYDNMPLQGLEFECTSATKPWHAQVELNEDYVGQTMQQIASSCIATTDATAASPWNYGLCDDVGSVDWDVCDEPLNCGSSFRVGLASNRRRRRRASPHPSDEWAMFVVTNGWGPDSFKGPDTKEGADDAPYIGGLGRTGFCPDGKLFITGVPAPITPVKPTCKDTCLSSGSIRRLGEQDSLPEELDCAWLAVDDQPTIAPQTTHAPNVATSLPDEFLAATLPPKPINWTNVVSFTVGGFQHLDSASIKAVRQVSASALSKVLEVPESACRVSLQIEFSACDLKVGIEIPRNAAYTRSNDINDLEMRILHALKDHDDIKVTLDNPPKVVEDLQELDPSCFVTTTTSTTAIDGVEMVDELQPVHGPTIITHLHYTDMSYDALINAADTVEKLKDAMNATMVRANQGIGIFYDVIVDVLPMDTESSGDRRLASGERSVVMESAMVQKDVSASEVDHFQQGFNSNIGSELTSAIGEDTDVSAILKLGVRALGEPDIRVFKAPVGAAVAVPSETLVETPAGTTPPAQAEMLSTAMPLSSDSTDELGASSAMTLQIGTAVFLPMVLLLINH